MHNKKSITKWALPVISTGILLVLLTIAILFYIERPAKYLFYDAENQAWNEIRVEFPNSRMGSLVILVVTFESPIDSLEDNNKQDFIENFNNNFEVTQITNNKAVTSFPQPLDQYGNSFLTIPLDQVYDGQTSVIIRMKEHSQLQQELLGDIYLDEFPK
ncbi:hypothetical protein IPN35_04045 [Candidatus Peregrinibacteria bacterium]|nr:MAG: hypothetical protein IPN35_04045 [Candidatus Peregrinibacteria bacterium]